MAEITLPTAVQRFVTATNTHDAEALLGVFAPGASVVDDGTIYDTEASIRAWLTVHQIDPRIVITPLSYDADRLVGSVDGDFPGGPLTFAFAFTVQDASITSLSIEQARAPEPVRP